MVGKERALGSGGARGLQQRVDGSKKYIAVISMAWKCLLLRRMSMLGRAFEQERGRIEQKEEKKKEEGGGRGEGFHEV